ncbi:MAG: hypothetical protein U5K76_06450 [Woeseiaceae bacterium]|nr:hypothetical protein [Woeseiaceae bacterium]
MAERNIVMRILSATWSGANAVRKVLHLVVLLFIFAVIFGALSSGAPDLPDEAALLIQPQGDLVEQLEGDPFDRAIAELMDDAPMQILVRDIVDGLEYARDDERIKAVVLDLSGLGGGGMSKLQRIAAAVQDFRESGKPVIAHADFFGQSGYFLAATRRRSVHAH